MKQGDKVRLRFDPERGGILTEHSKVRRGVRYLCYLDTNKERWPNCPNGVCCWAPEDQLEKE